MRPRPAARAGAHPAGLPLVAVLLLALLAGCTTSPAAVPAVTPTAVPAPAAGRSWAPAPVTAAGLTGVATVRGDRLALHTAGGDVGFWTGVDLGSTTPGHSPGELAIAAGDYRRWFTQMGRLGIRVVRVYAVHPPALYTELRRHNTAHPDAPIYLVQGVSLPDESYVHTGDLFAAGPTQVFSAELRAASAAVHGDLARPRAPRGLAAGTWTVDVSPWLAGWVVGVELDPEAATASDRRNAAAAAHAGRYFTSAPGSTPTERWLAARLDELAAAEAARGTTAPIAFVNWPTTDPLRHPAEPLPEEDLLQLDANHVRPTAAWPGGTFASYHAYPYYPDVQRHEPRYAGTPDPYGAYLADLRRHHAGMPLVVTEVGVPSSLGSAHEGPLDRDQGGHTEAEAMATDAALLRTVARSGASGGLVFSWSDEWFKATWNTRPRQAAVDAERRALWHDPLTNEQWFGLLATDPVRTGWRTVHEARDGVREVRVDTDASWVHLRVRLSSPPTSAVRLGFDVVPGGLALPDGTGRRDGSGGHDVAVVVDPAGATARASIRRDLDPLVLDGQPAGALPPADPDGWALQRLSTNRPRVVGGRELPAEYAAVGELQAGDWDRGDALATWRLAGDTLELRLPWSMLAIADPSSRTALVPVRGRATGVPVAQVGLVVDDGSGPRPVGAVRWEGWQRARHTERLKPGVQALADVMTELMSA